MIHGNSVDLEAVTCFLYVAKLYDFSLFKIYIYPLLCFNQ